MDRTEPSQQPERASFHLFTPPAGEANDGARNRAWKGDSFSFRDLLDIINPLQHLPVVSTLYRWITGDTIGALPRIIGDGIYGGPIGVVGGLFNAQVKQESGKDAGEHMIAMLGGEATPPVGDAATVAAKGAGQGGEVGASDRAGASGPPQPLTASAAPPPPSLTPRAGLHAPPSMPAASEVADPRAAFLARTSALHRQFAPDNGQLPGRALSNKVVPLQGIALPAGLLRANAARASSPGGTADGAAAPTSPPIDISQQMMEALDKYARMQQQRDVKRDASRGNQVDLVQ